MSAGNGFLEATLRRINQWLAERCREHDRRDLAPVAAAGL